MNIPINELPKTRISVLQRYCVAIFAVLSIQGITYAQAQSFSDSQLDTLVGPVALYPDPLLAQVLKASTHPEMVTVAEAWVQQHPDLAELGRQPWDASVLALANYQTVLQMMSQKIDWTTQLGQAYINQSGGVMQAVQRQRTLAQNNGNLVTTSQQEVIQNSGTIAIVPTQSTVIYVPQYNPTLVYTQSAVTYGAPLMAFGTGVAVGAWMTSTVNWNDSSVVYLTPGAGWYTTSVGGWGSNYYGSGARGYGTAVAASGTGVYGNQWNAANASGRTWNGGSWGAHAQTNDWQNGARTGSYYAAGAGPNGAGASRGWGYQHGDTSAGAYSKTVATNNGVYNVRGGGVSDGDQGRGSFTVSGVNQNGTYGSRTYNTSNGYVGSSTNRSGNVFSGSQYGGGYSNAYSNRGAQSRVSSYGGGGRSFGGGGFGGGRGGRR